MKKALLVCADKYPNGDAGAVRIHIFAKMLRSQGYEPTVVGMGPTTNYKFQKEEDISYISLRSPSAGLISKIQNITHFHKCLKLFLFDSEALWDIIIVSAVSKKTLDFLKRYSAKNKTLLIHDSVEWYSPEQFSIGRWHPNYIRKDCFNRFWVDSSMKVIAISNYLKDYFESRGIKTVRIPVLMDVQNMSAEKHTVANKTVFAYAGSPGKKDYIRTVIEGFAMLANDEREFELRLIGINREQLVPLCNVDEENIRKLGEHLICLGHVSREHVLEQLSETDFTVLIRSEDQRYAKAGFPTKFVESLATATPVIANLTSDLNLYLQDGKNGFIVEACSAKALSDTLMRALRLSETEKRVMQIQARKTAETQFDYKLYNEILSGIIDL